MAEPEEPEGQFPPQIEAAITAIQDTTGYTFSEGEREVIARLIEQYPRLADPSATPAQLAQIVEKVKQAQTLSPEVQLLAGKMEQKGTGIFGRIAEGLASSSGRTTVGVPANTEARAPSGEAEEDRETPTAVLSKLLTPTAGGYESMLTTTARTGTVTGETSGMAPAADAATVSFDATTKKRLASEAAFREFMDPQTKAEMDAELAQVIRTGGADFDVFKMEPAFVQDAAGNQVPLTYTDEFGKVRPIRDVEDPTLVPWDKLSPAAIQTRALTYQRERIPTPAPGPGARASDYERLKQAQAAVRQPQGGGFGTGQRQAYAELGRARANVRRRQSAAFGSSTNAVEERERRQDAPMAWSDVDSLSVDQLLEKPWLLSPDELTRLQVKLFEAGAYEDYGGLNYDPRKPLSAQIRLGDANDPTFKTVWRRFGNETMGDRTKTWMAHLETRRTTYRPILDYERELAAKQEAEEAASKIRKFSLTDPAAIRERGRQLGPEIGGRRLTPEEEAAVIEFIHARETALGQVETDPAVAGAVVDVDVDAELAEAIRGHMGVEADANDVAQQYITFTDLIRGPGR